MNCLSKHVILLVIGCIDFTVVAFSQNKVPSSGGVTVVDQAITAAPSANLQYIGEIKGYSYIKISMQMIQGEKPGTSDLTEYNGTYYEAVNGKVYTIKVSFDPENQSWNIKCFNRHGQYVSSFNGRETSEGVIEGTWRNKNKSLPFYLFKNTLKS